MKREKVFIPWMLFSFIAFSVSMAEGLEAGRQAPFFRVKSGGGKLMTLDSTRGKITVIFYETRDVLEQNRKLRNELNQSYRELGDTQKTYIVRLPIINCCDARWPFTALWRKKLREGSRKSGVIIYGDWDGTMLSAYGMKEGESNVVIIDKKGIIRYFKSGRIEDDETGKIKNLIEHLLLE